ncbi:MAG TPA: hypothetical protein VH307_29515 [Streptosporangiaceae bacterium]|nr:hypothetical protein [Streptosporangiaceae bacterium]
MPGPDAAPGAGGGDLRDPWDEGDWAAGEMLTPAEIMALEQAEGACDDPGWLAEDEDDVTPPGAEAAGGGVAEAWDAGFTHNVAGASGRGFEGGGEFDRMLPGRDLAGLTGRVLAGGLDRVSDYELIGFICAARRNTSWQQALELFAVAELEARRAGADGRPGEHVAAEVAAALTLTGRAAETLLGLAEGITRLRQVPAALAAGVIDLKRAEVFARELLVLGDELAARAEAMVMPRAPGMTTGQICAALQRAVLAVDPGAAQRRKKQAEKEGRVEAWGEPGRGTAALAGRDLPAAEVIAADKRLTAAARWLRGHGARGSLDWLRSRAYTGFLNGVGLDDLLAGLLAEGATRHDQDAGHSVGDAAGAGSGAAQGVGRDGDTAGPGSADRPSCAGSGSAGTASGARSPGPAAPRTPAGGSGSPSDGAPIPPALAAARVPPGLAALTGSVNLVMPARAWLGLSDAPGEITGTPAGGPADAATCRELADALAARGDARWCLTLTDPGGRAVAHGCARGSPGGPGPPGRASPGPPGRAGPGGPRPPGQGGPGPPDPLGWLRSIPLIPVERGECSHRLEVPGYRPSTRLRHQVKTRSRRCCFPGCRRPAVACDDDHTLAWHEGGRTCECNLSPLCRMHHRAKQAQGWHLSQPRPGTLVWILPSGRTYVTEPEPYPV